MEYTAADVKKLRDETGATFNDCKNALVESSTWEQAIKVLEAKSARKAEKVADREAKEGGVFSYIHHNNRVGALLELNCSTDFVARTEDFRQLASDLLVQIVGTAPTYVSYEDVPADEVEAAKKAVLEDPSMARVPEAKREDVINGKLKKQFTEKVLLMQPFLKDETITVGDLVRKVMSQSGENIVVRRFSRFALGE